MESLKAIIALSLRQLVRSRRMVIMAMISMAPVAFALVGVAIVLMRQSAAGVTGFGLATELASWAYLRGLLLIVTLFYATALMADEIEDKTITYLFVRPVPRWTIYLGKYIAAVITCLILIVPSFLLTFAVLSTLDSPGDVIRHLPILFKELGILALGVIAYCGLYGLFGAALKRPLLTGIIFTLIWEYVVSFIPGHIHRFTIAHYLQALLPHASAERGVLELFGQTTSPVTAILTLIIAPAILVALSCWTVSRKQYVLPA